ncbi:gamma-glutamyltransferase [Phytopseudomonas dryadis]|uniref:Glutathione hydrolase proenzyme n=1 Tax=Phytopseudomonas dryadis TaxID=2487520 RepID=A0ABY1YZJ6_9GAMM|nr:MULTISPECIES: gamma-glutamyltransferase [Pseudomonas]TBU99614.1 gamma-glutamyltransferase [Pseudomonas dryadis]TBV12549.1 gamma-glutamyltransferase [Pseudomonas sp. FRB 230]
MTILKTHCVLDRLQRVGKLSFILALWALNPAAQAGSPAQNVITTPHPLATAAGRQIIEAGGNAFDAAVAIASVLAVVEPYGSGLGGGGFFLLRTAGDTPQYRFLDARERAPLGIKPELYMRDGEIQADLSVDGALASAIPGQPAAMVKLSEQYGRLPIAASLEPAIRLARDGVEVDEHYRKWAGYRLEALRRDPGSARLFLSDGELPAQGRRIKYPELAASLQRLADHGRDGFYSGELARRLVDGVRKSGGAWTLEDLSDYQVVEREPLRWKLPHGGELISSPPPSAGGLVLVQSLGMLHSLPWRQAEPVQRAHYVVETLRRAYRDRGVLGDPDFVEMPLERLTTADYLQRQASSIDPERATPSSSLPPTEPWREGDHTTHFTVLDVQGNAVAATLSLNSMFGAAFTVPGTGILLNNEMDDFAIDVGGSNAYGLRGTAPNALAGGKRPISSMAPTFIESNQDFATFGTPGGSQIPSMILISLLAYLQGEPASSWVALPRYHHQYLPDLITHEPDAFSKAERDELQSLGHRLEQVATYGNQQSIHWNKLTGKIEGASDPRGMGTTEILPAQPAPTQQNPLR